MRMPKSLKHIVVGAMALTTFGVVTGVATSNITAHATSTQEDDSYNNITYTPRYNPTATLANGTKKTYHTYITSNSSSIGSAGIGGLTAFSPKVGTTFTFHNVGIDPNTNEPVTMKAEYVTIGKNVRGIGYKAGAGGVSLNMYGNFQNSHNIEHYSTVKLSFYNKKGNEINWNGDHIGLAFSDLEPKWLGVDGVQAESFNQSVQSYSKLQLWQPYNGIDQQATWIDKLDATQNQNFHMRERKGAFDFPSQAKLSRMDGHPKDYLYGYDVEKKKVSDIPYGVDHASRYLRHIWYNEPTRDLYDGVKYSGAIGVYNANAGKKEIYLGLRGHSQGNDEFVLSDSAIHTQKKTGISKSITYNGKTATSNTLNNVDDKMTYNLNANVQSKSGATMSDKLPVRFHVDSVSRVPGFKVSSAEEVNRTHTFKATVDNNNYTTDPKKVSFHITGSIGAFLKRHPDMNLKYPMNNRAEWQESTTSTPPKYSNTVHTNIAKRKVTFNFLDFDHHGKQLKKTVTLTNFKPGQSVELPTNIQGSNNHSYHYVYKDTDGRYSSPKEYTYNQYEKDSQSKDGKTYNLYYRTKWRYKIIHEVKGTKPGYDDPINENGDQLAHSMGSAFLKNDNGQGYRTYTGQVQYGLTNSKHESWIPVTSSVGNQRVQENDNQTIRFDYSIEPAGMTSQFDWIKLDTQKADTGKIPLSFKFHTNLLTTYDEFVAEHPLVAVPALIVTKHYSNAGEVAAAKQYNAHMRELWTIYYNRLQNATYRITFTNTTTGNVAGVYTGSLLDGSVNTKYHKHVFQDRVLHDSNLRKDQTNHLVAKIQFSDNGIIKHQTSDVAHTDIHTASQRSFTSADLQGTKDPNVSKWVYNPEIRTVYNGDNGRIYRYNEHYNMNFKTEVPIKTGYYDTFGSKYQYHSDTEQGQTATMPGMNMTAPNEFMTGNRQGNNTLTPKTVGLARPSVNNGVTGSGEAPSLADLGSWSAYGFSTNLQYRQVYSEMHNGNLHYASAIRSGSDNPTDTLINGGNKFYVPVWADVKPVDATFESKHGTNNDKPDNLGVNKVNFKFNKLFDVQAQMYADYNSKTKNLDELYAQPVYSESKYDKVPSNLSGVDQQWLKSNTDQKEKG